MPLYTTENPDNENVARMRSTKEKDFGHSVWKYFREYNDVTGIHGIRYVTEKRSTTERIFWIIILLLSLAGFFYMTYEIVEKYQNSPVVVSFATEDTPLYQIPFPAVTICPETKYSSQKFNYSKIYMQLQGDKAKINEADKKKFFHLSILCDDLELIEALANDTQDDTFYETIDQLKLDRELTLPLCIFDDDIQTCDKLFVPVLLDEGFCYSFNILGRDDIFKKHVFHYADYYHVPNKSNNVFNMETGYSATVGINTYPRRAMMGGIENSLMIFFRHDKKDTDFSCNGIVQGFKVLIHNPWDVPLLSQHHFRIPMGKSVLAAMEPELVLTSDSVRKFDPEKRKCFMADEKPLQYFKDYTQSNCFFECLTTYTLKQCGCVLFYMPRDNKTAICGNSKTTSECLDNAARGLKLKEIESKIAGFSYCDCKPTCTSLKYSVETSHTDFYFTEYFAAHPELEVPKDDAQWSFLQVYFKNEQFKTLERNELYGVSDLISNLGGLLGLFTGFSLITAVEILYFCSLRIFCNERMYGVWSGPPD